jgi:predicted nucleic-acid-binding protein
MIALDTNVFVRTRFSGDADMMRRAQAMVAAEKVHVAKTVVLESVWLLESRLGRSRGEVVEFLRDAIDTPSFVFEDRPAILFALDAMESGADPADALHLASTPEGAAFATFDRDIVRRAAASRFSIPIVVP